MVDKGYRGSVMLWARHGIGKSSVIRQLGKMIDYTVIDLRLAQQRLQVVADHELDQVQISENDCRHLPRFELRGCENHWKDYGYKRADIWDVVQHKRYDAPCDCEVEPDRKCEEKNRQAGHSTRQSAYEHVFSDFLGYLTARFQQAPST